MTAGSDDEQARRDARWVAHQARSRRSGEKVQLALVPLWPVLAAYWWFDAEADAWLRWTWTAVAVVHLGLGVVLWRQLRRTRSVVERDEAPGR